MVFLSQRLPSLEASGLSSQCRTYAGGKIAGLRGCSFKSCILFCVSAIIWRVRNETGALVCLFNTGQAVSVYIYLYLMNVIYTPISISYSPMVQLKMLCPFYPQFRQCQEMPAAFCDMQKENVCLFLREQRVSSGMP